MTTYAIAKSVPDDCDYLTAGKRYRVKDDGLRFWFFSDYGIRNCARWQNSAHLNGGNWTRVEGDEE